MPRDDNDDPARLNKLLQALAERNKADLIERRRQTNETVDQCLEAGATPAPSGLTPTPHRFDDPEWTFGDILGFFMDPRRELFGRIQTADDYWALAKRAILHPPADTSPPRSPASDRRTLLHWLQRGKLIAAGRDGTVDQSFWRGKSDILDALHFTAHSADVRRLYSQDAAPQVGECEAPEISVKGKRPLREKPIPELLEDWLVRDYGAKPGATDTLPSRDEMLKEAKVKVSPNVIEEQIRAVRRKFASPQARRGGAPTHRRKRA